MKTSRALVDLFVLSPFTLHIHAVEMHLRAVVLHCRAVILQSRAVALHAQNFLRTLLNFSKRPAEAFSRIGECR